MQNQLNAAESFKTIFIIYFAIIAGLILFFIIAMTFVGNTNNLSNKELDKVFTILVPIFGIIVMFASRTLYYKNVSKIDRTNPLENRLTSYRTFKIISWALIEAGSMFSLVAYMLTSNYLYVIVFLFLAGFLFMIRPSKENFIKDFNVSSQDSEIILKKS